jgi:hypothetical protein
VFGFAAPPISSCSGAREFNGSIGPQIILVAARHADYRPNSPIRLQMKKFAATTYTRPESKTFFTFLRLLFRDAKN